ncbi:DEAD/DEAH box helicase [Pseudomonas synxantha]|uniref:Uncharacterized protein n=1 Tax=Pseudomonas synxantha TaxID=47883 RepID=A0ACC6JRL1_9PSED|nr:DEAD/DEAH box helicase [Pseudomonas synxantha]MDR6609028.1 hypothetical protein [Pseudomonas synxantha]
MTSFSSDQVLAQLKDFQRTTVDYAFYHLFDSPHPTRRFLVADEVGLGKTLVAKGLIARVVERLQVQSDRIDIIYVCSNADIAAQNVARLMLPGQPSFARATRLTLLPLEVHRLREHSINFISFTPGTTFNQGNRPGRKDERRLIYQMLAQLPGLSRRGLRNALQGQAKASWFIDADIKMDYDTTIATTFCSAVIADNALHALLIETAESYSDRRRKKSPQTRDNCLRLIGDLRRCLAKSCLSSLNPNLIILDEFQRFNDLLAPADDNPAAELAQAMFNSSVGKVLLLSATPYKMFSSALDEEDHYEDFLKTVGFLMEDERKMEDLKADIARFRSALLSARSSEDIAPVTRLKARIESALQSVMCRTERVGLTKKQDAMVQPTQMVPALTSGDLFDLRTVDAVARRLDQPDIVEHWKSAPYLANFMHEYNFKRALRSDQSNDVSVVADLFQASPGTLLNSNAIEKYLPVDTRNARVRLLMQEIESQGLWRLLWMPPSLPYWKPTGVFSDVESVSKQLIFSAWNVVPDAIASLISYEVERLLVKASPRQAKYSTMPKKFSPHLKFSRGRDGKPGGMTSLMLIFPSLSLAELINPLDLIKSFEGANTYEDLRQLCVELIAEKLEPLISRDLTDGQADRRWYWVALARLEKMMNPATRTWCEYQWRHARTREGDDGDEGFIGFQSHVEQWLEAWDDRITDLGKVPEDLFDVLVDVALAAPGVCALRSLLGVRSRISGSTSIDYLNSAALIAEGLRRQFNSPRAVALLSSSEEEDSYWKLSLQYCIDGNLQSLLDEYSHVLLEAKCAGFTTETPVHGPIAEAMFEAMTLRTSTLHPDLIETKNGRLQISPLPQRLRSHFALRFGAQTEDLGAVARKESVQAAFNSPFWPFYLASTSVGQEGLDFHPWCHTIVHWNLPSNPVDMEQREGRVHRYKGHAVRKNVARAHRSQLSLHGVDESLWAHLFTLAVKGKPAGISDIVPYWVYETEGGAKVERRVMCMPMSKDQARYQKLCKDLAMYRMVFAQPRQEDLMACLEQVLGDDFTAELAAYWQICLAPSLPSKSTSLIEGRGALREGNT